MEELTAISLFSGIGGDTLAAQWAGFRTLVFVEIDKFCQVVLKKHWPDIPLWGNIDDFKAEKYRGNVTLVHGGDPCQPNSVAGKRRGKEDDRYKWPQMLRVVHECQPTWVVSENPTGRLSMDFYEVLLDLEGEGYEVSAFVIPACAVNAPHRRDRVYIVAYSEQLRRRGRDNGDTARCERPLQIERPDSDASHSNSRGRNDGGLEGQGIQRGSESRTEDRECFGDVADSNAEGLQGYRDTGECARELIITQDSWQESWLEVATALCGVDDGLPDRVARLKALGNAQVPQQIYPIFKAIADIERLKKRA